MFILFQYIIYKILLDTLLSIATLENLFMFYYYNKSFKTLIRCVDSNSLLCKNAYPQGGAVYVIPYLFVRILLYDFHLQYYIEVCVFLSRLRIFFISLLIHFRPVFALI